MVWSFPTSKKVVNKFEQFHLQTKWGNTNMCALHKYTGLYYLHLLYRDGIFILNNLKKIEADYYEIAIEWDGLQCF